ncbi:hypothetical protein AD929_11545 [Gluconobacter potus]|uniref:Uncharacterized protein n=2 Tax=Gluconobacter potus TaxID=2724927 RepID=A0A149QSH3_9PROT|nr:hypothetical protein AD929_11545 [Gluconobacter potus]
MPDFDLMTVRKSAGCESWRELAFSSTTRMVVLLGFAVMVGADLSLWAGLAIDKSVEHRDVQRRSDLITMVGSGADPVAASCPLSMIDPDSVACAAIRNPAGSVQ